jgi:CRP-like cAMP-binding protein
MKRFAKGSILFREGDPGSDMYVIGAGKVEVIKRIGGVDKTIAVVGPGEMLGELALLNGKPRTATAVVLEQLDALVIDSNALSSMLSSNAEFTMRLIRRLADRLDVADGLVRLLLHPDPDARDLVLRQAESAKSASLSVEMEVQGEVAGDPARIRELFGRLNRLRARLSDGAPAAANMPRPFSMKSGGKKGGGGPSGGARGGRSG